MYSCGIKLYKKEHKKITLLRNVPSLQLPFQSSAPECRMQFVLIGATN